MSSRREDERNEKIIRGLMKLPPNRRCINCNSMGPQYVCTNFWTLVCTTCSGIHREFTHRVKSVSMAKFTSQEVDSLQKGGNQRARELYLKAWDLQRQRLPDNSNVEKVREFIKNVYVKKMYAVEKSPDRPPRDPQGLRNYEDETRRASSYHSYSQSPPYDFQYEERRYGKHTPSLSRRPGSDRGIYEGKLSGFSSPSRLSEHANSDMFANDDSNSRASDCSASAGGDLFRSNILTPSSQRDTGSPFRDSLKGISSEVSRNDIIFHNSDVNSRSNGGRLLHPQRTASLGSFGSFDSDSISFKSVNSLGLPEVDPEPSAKISQDKSTSFPSYMQASANENFGGLDLFAEPLAPQNVNFLPPAGIDSQLQISASGTFGGLDLFAETIVPRNFTSAASTCSNSQLLQPSLSQSVSSFSTFADQQMSHTPETSSVDLSSQLLPKQLIESSHGKIPDGVIPNNGGWATFDIAQTATPFGMDKLGTTTVLVSDQNTLGNFNPFSYHQSAYSSAGHEPATSSPLVLQEGRETVETTTNSTNFWNAFEDSTGQQPIPSVGKNNNHFDVLGFVASEVMNNDGNPRSQNETLSFSLSSHTLPLNDISAVAGLHSSATDHKASNPFDLPYDTDMESHNMLWDISSLQAALPISRNYIGIGDVNNQSWFPQNPYVPAAFDHPTGSLGLVAIQTPNTHLSNIPSQAPVGGNPFA